MKQHGRGLSCAELPRGTEWEQMTLVLGSAWPNWVGVHDNHSLPAICVVGSAWNCAPGAERTVFAGVVGTEPSRAQGEEGTIWAGQGRAEWDWSEAMEMTVFVGVGCG